MRPYLGKPYSGTTAVSVSSSVPCIEITHKYKAHEIARVTCNPGTLLAVMRKCQSHQAG